MISQMSILDLVKDGPDYLDLIPTESAKLNPDATTIFTTIEAGIGIIATAERDGMSFINNQMETTTRSVLDEMVVNIFEAEHVTATNVDAEHISVSDLLNVEGELHVHRDAILSGSLDVSGPTKMGSATVGFLDVSGSAMLNSVDVMTDVRMNMGGDIKYYARNDYSQRSMIDDLDTIRMHSDDHHCDISNLKNQMLANQVELSNLLENMVTMNSKLNEIGRSA